MLKVNEGDLGKILKRQRVIIPLTMRDLAVRSGVSASHIGRIERGERLPSARILRKIAEPLGFKESELFILAGYLSQQPDIDTENQNRHYYSPELDPYVANVLSRQPVEIQRAVVGILSAMQSLAGLVSRGVNNNELDSSPRLDEQCEI